MSFSGLLSAQGCLLTYELILQSLISNHTQVISNVPRSSMSPLGHVPQHPSGYYHRNSVVAVSMPSSSSSSTAGASSSASVSSSSIMCSSSPSAVAAVSALLGTPSAPSSPHMCLKHQGITGSLCSTCVIRFARSFL